jgi:hypothetical protein
MVQDQTEAKVLPQRQAEINRPKSHMAAAEISETTKHTISLFFDI